MDYHEGARFRWWWVALAVVLLALVFAGVHLWYTIQPPDPVVGRGVTPRSMTGIDRPRAIEGRIGGADGMPVPPESVPGTQSSAEPSRAPGIPRYPLPAGVAREDDPSLPELSKSDAPILQALGTIAPRADLGRFGNIGDFTKRVVITVDNLPRELVPAQYSIVQRIPGALAVSGRDERMSLQPENFRRYDPFISFAESVGSGALVSVYLRFYPLFQKEYRAMGFPQGHFHDRVIEAIDDMLSAPEPAGTIWLVQPKVHYRFEDPRLEALSAGRKIMIRVGPDNARRLKTLLRSIREELIS
jgi:hypothetical protein